MSREDLQSLLGRVTTDGIVETAVKESVDFIVRLGERPDVGARSLPVHTLWGCELVFRSLIAP